MPDNVLFTQGSGTTLRSVDVGGVQHPAAVLFDAAGNAIQSATAAPAGTERGLIVRQAGHVRMLAGPDGRTPVSVTANRIAGNAATEALASLVKMTGTTAAAAVSTGITASSGKTLRLTGWSLVVRNSSAVFQGLEAYLRVVASGNVALTSPIVAIGGTNAVNALSGSVGGAFLDFDDAGLEVSGTQAFGISIITTTAAAQVSLSLHGYEY
jgi:hypothetical protein